MKPQTLITQAEQHYAPEQITRLKTAIGIATKAHAGQRRKSGEPYITHPLHVASILIDWRLDIDSVIAGVLHDVVEDTSVELSVIEVEFGDDVAFLVDGVTKVGKVRSGMRDITEYRPETRENLSKLLIAVGHDLRVVIIKLADRLHNLQTLKYLSAEKQHKIARESLDVFAPLADRMGMGRVRVQIEELAFSYLEPQEYQQLQGVIKQRVRQAHRNLETVRKAVEDAFRQAGLHAQLEGRIKSVYSLHKKLRKVGGDFDEIYDLIALRVLVGDTESCYRALGILHALYQPLPTRIKDYISVPKPNGYQSLHTTVLTPEGQVVEFQIRTDDMHLHAERGLAASFHYNEQKLAKNYVRGEAARVPRNMQWVVTLQEAIASLDSDSSAYERLRVDLFSDRIFTYSPKGDIYDLPEGATALDFAFAVHSDIGLHAHTIRVNQKIATFDKPLHNGDIVEVLTQKRARPHADWVDFLRTDKARSKVRSYLHNMG